MAYNETPTPTQKETTMSHTRAIELTPVNFKTIVRDTPFTEETLTALHASSPYLYVVKDRIFGDRPVFLVLTSRNIIKFGFPDTSEYWFDCITK